MKKAVILVLSAFLTLSMAACSNTKIPSGSSDDPSLNSETDLVEPVDSMAEEPTENGNDFISEQYEIGDIILSDGSIVKEADLTSVDSSNVPIAVIAGFKEDGMAFGVGVHRSDEPLQWASDDSAGYAANFTDTVCTQESDFDFMGDTDGEDNWKAICDQESEDTADAEVNYPAFHFVNTYASNFCMSGEMASGWYMPSIAELCKIYQNREAVNNSLQHIYRLDEQAAMNGLETNWYWSASQAVSSDDYAWFVHYFNGYAGECPKNFTNVHALAVRAFVGVGSGLVVLFFVIGFCAESVDIKSEFRLEAMLRMLIRLGIAQWLVANNLTILKAFFSSIGAMVSHLGNTTMAQASIGAGEAEVIENLGFAASLIFLILSAILSLIILICGFFIIYTVYFRFLKIMVIVPLAAIAFSTLAGNRTVSTTCVRYFKYFLSVVMEAVTMALAILICNAFISAGFPAFTGGYADWAQVLIYLCEITFTIALTVGACKGAQSLTGRALGL